MNMMGYTKLKQLKRYQLYEIEMSAETLKDAQEKIEHVVNRSYYLLNPNKENFCLEKIPQRKTSLEKVSYWVNVRSKGQFDEEKIIRKIHQKLTVNIKSIKKSLLWELVVQNGSQSEESLKKELLEKVIVSQSNTQGLLTNPVHERVEFLSKTHSLV